MILMIKQRFQVGAHVLGAISYSSAAVWAYRYVTSVLSTLLERHSNLCLETNTPIQSVERCGSGIGKGFLVKTAPGSIRSTHVIHATNSHASHLIPGLCGNIFPLRGQITAQRSGEQFPSSENHRSWSFIQKKGFDYAVQIPLSKCSSDCEAGQLVVGGGVFQSSGGFDELGNTSEDTPDPVIGAYLGGILPMVFGAQFWGRGHQEGRVTDTWTGTMGYTADVQPYVERLNDRLCGRGPRNSALLNNPTLIHSLSSGSVQDSMVKVWFMHGCVECQSD